MINLVISIVSYALAAFFLARGFQDMAILDLLIAAVFTGVGKTYVRRYKETK